LKVIIIISMTDEWSTVSRGELHQFTFLWDNMEWLIWQGTTRLMRHTIMHCTAGLWPGWPAFIYKLTGLF